MPWTNIRRQVQFSVKNERMGCDSEHFEVYEHKMQNVDANRGKDVYRLIYLLFLSVLPFHFYSVVLRPRMVFSLTQFSSFRSHDSVDQLANGKLKSPNAMDSF